MGSTCIISVVRLATLIKDTNNADVTCMFSILYHFPFLIASAVADWQLALVRGPQLHHNLVIRRTLPRHRGCLSTYPSPDHTPPLHAAIVESSEGRQ